MLRANVQAIMDANMRAALVWVSDSVRNGVWAEAEIRNTTRVRDRGAFNAVQAYTHACELACYRFFDLYLAPNEAHALACFKKGAGIPIPFTGSG